MFIGGGADLKPIGMTVTLADLRLSAHTAKVLRRAAMNGIDPRERGPCAQGR